MKPAFCSLCCLRLAVWRADAGWQPSPGHTQLPIWAGAVPDPQPVRGRSHYNRRRGKDGLMRQAGAGGFNVNAAYETVYSPQGNNTALQSSSSRRGLSGSGHRF